jgi:cyclic pyranopterin phosphate synthase
MQPLTDQRPDRSIADHRAPPAPAARASRLAPVVDTLGRMLPTRISVTDRCNFRCVYCMPRDVFGRDYPFLPHDALLTFEEIARVAGVFAGLGVEKIRLTGGEPLLRKHLEKLVAMLAPLPVDLTLTTNGALLARKAQALADAGLKRVTVSLDAIDERRSRTMGDTETPVARARGHRRRARARAGEINSVIKRGVNGMRSSTSRAPRGTRTHRALHQYMDVGAPTAGAWTTRPPGGILDRIAGFRSSRSTRTRAGRQRWRWDGAGEIGIASVTRAFCAATARACPVHGGKLYLPVRDAGPDPARSSRQLDDAELRARSRRWRRRGDVTQTRAATAPAARSRCRIGG